MRGPRARKRFFVYAVIGAVAGSLFFAFPDHQIGLVLLLASVAVAGLVMHLRRRADALRQSSFLKDGDDDDESPDEVQRERWRRDLDIAPSVAGVRGFSVDADDWKTPDVDSSAGSSQDANRN